MSTDNHFGIDTLCIPNGIGMIEDSHLAERCFLKHMAVHWMHLRVI